MSVPKDVHWWAALTSQMQTPTPKYSLYLVVYYNLHQMLEFQSCDMLITSYGTMFLLPVRLDMPVTLDDQTISWHWFKLSDENLLINNGKLIGFIFK